MSDQILNAKIMFNSSNIPEYQNKEVADRINKLTDELKELTCTISKPEVALAVASGVLAALINSALKGPFSGNGQWKNVEKCKEEVTAFCQKIPFLKINDFDDAARFITGNALLADNVIKNKFGISATDTVQETKEALSENMGSFIANGGNEFFRMWLNDAAGVKVGLDADGKGTIDLSKAKKLSGDQVLNATSNVAALWFLGQCAKPIDMLPEDIKPFADSLDGVLDKGAVADEIKKLLNNTKLGQAAGKLGGVDLADIRDKTMTAAPAVLINEALLRGIYTAENVLFKKDSNHDIFNDRNFKRMRTIASSTLSFCDGGDAALRAAMTCGGNIWAFLGNFAVNVNYAAVGDAAIAIYKDSVDEKAEQQAWSEMADMKIQYAEEYIPQLVAYRKKLEEDLGRYIKDEATDILNSLDGMQEAINNNDSDAFIKFNVAIQEKNGVDPQFKNQKEFDELMASNTTFEF